MLGTDAAGFGSGGNGVITACVWCGCLVGERAGYLRVPHRYTDGRFERVPVLKMEQDRITPGTRYSIKNCLASCPPCNRVRGFEQQAAAHSEPVEDCILVRGY